MRSSCSLDFAGLGLSREERNFLLYSCSDAGDGELAGKSWVRDERGRLRSGESNRVPTAKDKG